jgi:hypothetical protein
MQGREVEMTFSIDLADVESVYRAFSLPSAPGRGQSFRTFLMPSRTVLHFYLPPAPGEHVRRLRIRRRRDQYAISLESKQVIREDPMLIEKEETVVAPRLSLEHVRQMMSGSASIVSSFIKNQYRARLKSDSGVLKVSLDQMLPFRADRPTILAPQFWHLEIEEVQGWPVPEFLDSHFFRCNLSTLRPLRQSKWELARISSPVGLKTDSAQHFRDYLDSLFGEGERQTHSFARMH